MESGTYACGVSQYKSGEFTDSETTINLPPGTTYYLQQGTANFASNATSEQYDAGGTYTDCAFETSDVGVGAL